MNLTWLLLILAVALIAIGTLRFDVLVARWRELFGKAPAVRDPPPAHPAPPAAGMQPHDAPLPKPPIHRSGKRH
jgi:hypothetical protein